MKHSGSGKKLSVGEGLAAGAMGPGRGRRCFWKRLYPCTLGKHQTPREEIFLIHKVKEKSLLRNQKAVEGECAVSLSHVQLFATPWTVAHWSPLSVGILQVRLLEWVAMPSSRVCSQPRNQIQVSCMAGGFYTI